MLFAVFSGWCLAALDFPQVSGVRTVTESTNISASDLFPGAFACSVVPDGPFEEPFGSAAHA